MNTRLERLQETFAVETNSICQHPGVRRGFHWFVTHSATPLMRDNEAGELMRTDHEFHQRHTHL